MNTRLKAWFAEHPQVALAFSGGVDSVFLLHAAREAKAHVRAYYVISAFQPRFEREDARKLAASCGVKLTEIPLDVLADTRIASNPPDRCYWCKRAIFNAIANAAQRDGLPVVIDGTNASDNASDRPGMRALQELGVRSPLRECGLTKRQIRKLSHEFGLPTWNKPSYSCLATRISHDQPLTAEALAATERAESFLRECGFSDFRVRRCGSCARIQLPRDQWDKLLNEHEAIRAALAADYDEVLLDLKERTSE
ncbi:ATP-dependent sacrificial sulfur transferase LarE [Adlercreutzia sp. ZJ141]|uniref:ATP-dependent sacrificial sulfur transferase LarE n=1 Tax=Adlercreutzia sp. ZJ141 TaxID=2709406 RepID=UPI001F154AFC|nr:ATP-dependent sacrificial sulfur transferase LarE [Adlercreutzia sp. ZJ141]